MHRAATVGFLVIATACSGTHRGPRVSGDRLEPAGSVKEPEPVVATGHIPTLPTSVTLADFTPPVSAPTGTSLSLPAMPWHVGDRLVVWTTSGGHEAATADTYEAVQTINAVDVDLVADSGYEVLNASMSSMGGSSALHGKYRIKIEFDRVQLKVSHVSFEDGDGTDLPTGLAQEELSELGNRAVLLPWSAFRSLHDVPLREGETKALDAEQKKAFGSNPAEQVWFARLPDDAGVSVFRIYRHLAGNDAGVFRLEMRYDTRTKKPVRVERIDAPRSDLAMWYIVVTEFGPA